MSSNKIYFLVFVAIFFCTNIQGQDADKKQSLTDILITIQNQYNYQFNYEEETVKNIEIVPPVLDFPFQSVIDYLRKQTNLVFTVIDDNFVLIKKRKTTILVCGYLKDKDSQKPIVNASIQGKRTSTTSNTDGYFELNIDAENELLKIRHLGYKTRTVSYSGFNTDDCLSIALVRQEETLSEIILSTYLIKGIDKLKDGSFQIDFSKFSMLPGLIESDVLQSVQAFPGIQSSNETVSNINVRGGTHDQNLLLWDDIKMYQSGHFFGLISVFNPNITKKVSLQKNATDASYTDGVSSTISMKTDTKLNDNFNGNISLSFIDFNGFMDIPLSKKSSIQIAGRKSLSDLVKTPTYDTYFERISQDTEVETNLADVRNSNEEFNFYDFSFRWLYKISDSDEIRLNFINIDNELVFNESATINGTERSIESSLSQNSIAGGLNYKRTWNNKFKTDFQIYETDYKLKAFNTNLIRSQRSLQENIVSETGIKLHTMYNLSDRIRWDNGYQFIETKVTNLDDVDDPLFRLLISEVLRTHSLFSQAYYTSENKLTNLTLGIRYNYLDKFKKHLWEPRISFNQKFLNDFTFEIQGELKNQNTSQVINFQNDFLGIEKRRWQLSNNDSIPVITSKQLSAGVSFNKKNWLITMEGYYKDVDGITTQSQGFQNDYEFVKTDGSYEAIGVDFLIRKRFNNINFWCSYSYLNSDYTFDSLPEINFPSNFDITHSVGLGATYSTKNLKVSAGFNWHSGNPTTRPELNNEVTDDTINYDPTNSDRLNEYFRVDLSAMYQLHLGKKHQLSIGASVWNLLDQQNIINNYYRINTAGEVEEVTQNSLSIVPNVLLRMNF
ncbi:TonB-dependent receptor [Aquimarina rubra]|uniref:Carboxypeptidase-like regulatory domain-containing protein n=1 Tax=Aquimarina rubra TaxID=1920033 RepID=A0ABW5LKI8_9FLAO